MCEITELGSTQGRLKYSFAMEKVRAKTNIVT